MHMLIRTLWHMWFVGPRGSKLKLHEMGRSRFRVWPTDLDILNHMNNGKYLSILDLGRFDLMQRNGIWELLKKEGWYPVVVAQTISYRKSLEPWMRFWTESKVLGFDDQAVYLEQRFVRPNKQRRPEVYARAYVRARILRRGGGVVPVADMIAKSGADLDTLVLPDEVLEWGKMTRLPSTRDEAVSVWE